MKYFSKHLVNITFLTCLMGCSSANFNSVYRTFDVNTGDSISVDAKQRVVLVRKIESEYIVREQDGEKHVQKDLDIRVCAEPSPDTLSVFSASLSGDVDIPENVKTKIATALSEEGSNIGLRTQTIQLLRDSMYRLCEGYLSGALNNQDFERLQRRYQNSMVALLAIEQLTGGYAQNQLILNLQSEESKKMLDFEKETNLPIDSVSTSNPEIDSMYKSVIEIVKLVVEADFTREECVKKLVSSGYGGNEDEGIKFCKAYLEQQTKEIRTKLNE
ncbi:hypothetical protein [Paraglaciecola chathamensis]|uniref:hypothetical protein n=1 Tax=Paraglaciecola chathamensis TaxID=368405 RepID=UPI0027046599|nr:hypothetical protein [Paraglaciecola chathamensis]MDO6559409.1 hypothetical protein [Paraglaciecola chathamensis]